MADSGKPADTAPPSAPPPAIPGHELLRRIGEGTYGEVWLARSSLGNGRAVKIVHRARFPANAERAYEREFRGMKLFEPVSREHPGFVDILQVGRDDAGGCYHYVMELADDAAATANPSTLLANSRAADGYTPRTLAEELQRRGQLPARELVVLSVRLVEALEFLHRQKLVHRDIKPANIIFVGGEPKLADVGLVSELGATQSLLGTPGFIPPEGPGTAQGDIYSLGKVIYEAATGKDRQEFPELPTQIETAPDAAELLALNDIILKACERHPARRYQSASDMLAELRLLERGESVRRARWRRQLLHRVAIGLISALLITGVVALLRGPLWPSPPAQAELPQRPVIFVNEEFNGDHLDPKQWLTGITNSTANPEHPGRTECFFAQSNGYAHAALRVRHEGGGTRKSIAWLELDKDLRAFGRCRVEITLSGVSINSELVIGITDGTPPSLGDAVTNEVVVRKVFGRLHSPAELSLQTLSIDLIPDAQVAALREAGNALSIEDVFDVSTLPAWRLRFRLRAASSVGFDDSAGNLRIQAVRVVQLTFVPVAIGKVQDALTGWPVGGAGVLDESGVTRAITRNSGTFFLENPGDVSRLKAEKAGWLSVTLDRKNVESDGLMRLGLRKQQSEYGDVVGVIPCAPAILGGLEFRANELWAVGRYPTNELNQSLLFKLDSYQNRMAPIGKALPYQQVSVLASTASRLWGFKVWKGIGFNLTNLADQTTVGLRCLNGDALDWPADAAFDGQWVWVANRDLIRSNVSLCALNPETLQPVFELQSRDMGLCGLAWDGEQFWTSSDNGEVHLVNREWAMREEMLEAGRRDRIILGYYTSLAFGNGHLWGLTHNGTAIHKIQIRD